MFVTVILNTSPLPDFEDLRARLIAFENQNSTPSEPTQIALLATQPTGQSTGLHHQPVAHGNVGRYQTFSNSNNNKNGNGSRGRRGRGNRNNNNNHWNRNSGPVCQNCNHSGHTSQWYTYGQRPQSAPPSAAFTYAPPPYYPPPYAPLSYTPSTADPLTTAFAGLQLSNSGYQPQQIPNT
ncbi:hypothetical protein FRX31_034849, partial [Thalictrum thalictroides]